MTSLFPGTFWGLEHVHCTYIFQACWDVLSSEDLVVTCPSPSIRAEAVGSQ